MSELRHQASEAPDDERANRRAQARFLKVVIGLSLLYGVGATWLSRVEREALRAAQEAASRAEPAMAQDAAALARDAAERVKQMESAEKPASAGESAKP
ncbi:hypothetical protein [Piscinibacterium candidicorallinum]|uniref:Uncharacterized protein n=1 Tax=Piscinibacterium candidicorallinum TaxID=1793872 RepID=A0ABV7H343_9BURK